MPYGNKCEDDPYIEQLSLRTPKRNVHVPITYLAIYLPNINVIFETKKIQEKAKGRDVKAAPYKPFVEGSVPVFPKSFQVVAIVYTLRHILRGFDATYLK